MALPQSEKARQGRFAMRSRPRSRGPGVLPVLVTVAVLGGLPSCAGIPSPTPAATGSSAGSAASTPTAGLYEVNGHHLYLTCAGSGQPTVMLEAGLDSDHADWAPVDELAAYVGTRVCAYDRYGLGESDIPATVPTRTIDQVVDDLHTLIGAAHITGPLVLAGHSMGGLIVRELTRRYPRLVAGMLLFDSAPDDWDVYTGTETFNDGFGESIDVQAASAALRGSDTLGSMPLIVVQAGDDSTVQQEWAPTRTDFSSYWNSRQIALARLSTDSILVMAPGIPHNYVAQQPALLSPTAMKLVVGAVRSGHPLPGCGGSGLPQAGARCLSESG